MASNLPQPLLAHVWLVYSRVYGGISVGGCFARELSLILSSYGFCLKISATLFILFKATHRGRNQSLSCINAIS